MRAWDRLIRQPPPAQPSETEFLEIIRRVKSTPRLPGTDNKLVLIAPNATVKVGGVFEETIAEQLSMQLVSSQTRIAVPRVHRVIKHNHSIGDAYLVMDYIPNARRLQDAWSDLSLWGKLRVVITLRVYLRQLRRVKHPESAGQPGPPGPKPLQCHGLQFYNDGGPFPTPASLAAYYQNQHDIYLFYTSRGMAKAPTDGPPPESAFTPLVFTHNDLNMRNILLDDKGTLWIVDWAFAGFYPTWFEYLGMNYAATKDEEPRSWLESTEMIAESPAPEIARWFEEMEFKPEPFRRGPREGAP